MLCHSSCLPELVHRLSFTIIIPQNPIKTVTKQWGECAYTTYTLIMRQHHEAQATSTVPGELSPHTYSTRF